MEKTPLLQMTGISKNFGSVQALTAVDFELLPNEVLGLLGDNGAGKSTLIKIISGVYPPDEGKINLLGKEVIINNPAHAKSLGIETTYQDLALLNKMNVPENIFLGRERNKILPIIPLRILDKKGMEQETLPLLQRLKINIGSLRTRVENFSGGQRQATAIAKSIFWKAKIIILDEPTAALGVAETEKVRSIIKDLRKEGISVIFISHNLEDVFTVADRVIVLRGGRRVGSLRIAETSRDEIVRLMVSGEPARENARV